MNNVISAKNICKEFDNFKLSNISLDLEQGKLFGILGPNGSGKTTLVKILTGQIMSDSGEINILDTNPAKDPLKTKEVIGIIPEQESPPSFLTVIEYLEFIAKVRNLKNKDSKITHWLRFLELKEQKNYLIKNLSRGMKQKILFIQAFIHEPKLVFIDEPLINLDPIIQKKIKTFLREYVEKGNTIFLSTHILSIAEEICDEVCILKQGKNIFTGNTKKIIKEHHSLENYFIKLS